VLILGITNGTRCGTALVDDGAAVAAVNKEALSCQKRALGLPRQAVAEMMRIGGMATRDIDLICVAIIGSRAVIRPGHVVGLVRFWLRLLRKSGRA
jgi:predicted NodU family carbamoyl transferase